MESTEKPNDPLSRFSLGIFTLNGILMRNGDQVTRPIGQSSARWQVLGRVGYQPYTVAQIARDMGHARQSVQRIADVLKSEGLIVYTDNPTDRRAQLVQLTSRGREALDAIYVRHQEWTQRIMTKLSPKQLATVADALEEIGQILEADMDKNSKNYRQDYQ